MEMTDAYTPYERGLTALLDRIGRDDPAHAELLVFQQRLSENISETRLLGDTEQRRADRASIIAGLNALAQSALAVTFNTLCSLSGAGTSHALHQLRTLGGDLVMGEKVAGDKAGGDKVMGDKRTINTGGGDYAEGNIDKRQGVFISGGTVYGSVIGQTPQQPAQPSAGTSLRRNHPPRIRLIPHLQQPVHKDDDRWASIIVLNEEIPALIDCRGTLREVVHILDDDSTDEVVSDTPRPLGWSTSGPPAPNGLATIRYGESQALDVARTDKAGNVIRFTTLFQGDWNPQPPGRYRVRVSVGGKLEGTSFSPVIIECLLIYGGGTNLTILPSR